MSSRVSQSHTATDQWQRFELRMRRRRIERCMLRASAAFDEGLFDGAVEAVEEAAHLDPYDESIKALAEKIRTAAAAPVLSPIPEIDTAVPLNPVDLSDSVDLTDPVGLSELIRQRRGALILGDAPVLDSIDEFIPEDTDEANQALAEEIPTATTAQALSPVPDIDIDSVDNPRDFRDPSDFRGPRDLGDPRDFRDPVGVDGPVILSEPISLDDAEVLDKI